MMDDMCQYDLNRMQHSINFDLKNRVFKIVHKWKQTTLEDY